MEKENQQEQEQKMFTQDEVNKLMGALRKENREKYADYDDLKAKASKFDEIEQQSKSELERITERATKAETELKQLKTKAEHDQLKAKIADELKVPAKLLHGKDEEELRSYAQELLEFKKPSVGASVPKNSVFTNNANTTSVKEDFAQKVI